MIVFAHDFGNMDPLVPTPQDATCKRCGQKLKEADVRCDGRFDSPGAEFEDETLP